MTQTIVVGALFGLALVIAYWLGRLEERARWWFRVALAFQRVDYNRGQMLFWVGWEAALGMVGGEQETAHLKNGNALPRGPA